MLQKKMEISSSTLFHSEAARGEHFHSDFFPHSMCDALRLM